MDKLPKGWKITKLGNITNVKSSKRIFADEYVSVGIPFYRSKEIVELSKSDSTKGDLYISVEKYLEIKAKFGVPQEGDMLLTSVGTIGKTWIVDNREFYYKDGNLTQLEKNDNIDMKFIQYYFQSPLFTETINEKVTGTAYNALTIQKINQLEIPLPPLPEQTRIVKKLDSLFERIDKSIALLEENIKHTKALMASVLDDTFKKLESISKVYKIKEFADIKGGKRLPKGKSLLDTKTIYPYIRVTDFNDNGSVDVESIKYMEKDVQDQIKRYIITSKDVYISIAGTIGKTGIIPDELNNANLTENAARLVFKPNFEINNRFIYYFTLSDNFKDQIGLATKTVAQPKLALTRLAEVELPIPTLDIQNKEVLIFDELSKKFQEIKIQQQSKLSYLKALKASLLDKSFKGEL